MSPEPSAFAGRALTVLIRDLFTRSYPRRSAGGLPSSYRQQGAALLRCVTSAIWNGARAFAFIQGRPSTPLRVLLATSEATRRWLARARAETWEPRSLFHNLAPHTHAFGGLFARAR